MLATSAEARPRGAGRVESSDERLAIRRKHPIDCELRRDAAVRRRLRPAPRRVAVPCKSEKHVRERIGRRGVVRGTEYLQGQPPRESRECRSRPRKAGAHARYVPPVEPLAQRTQHRDIRRRLPRLERHRRRRESARGPTPAADRMRGPSPRSCIGYGSPARRSMPGVRPQKPVRRRDAKIGSKVWLILRPAEAGRPTHAHQAVAAQPEPRALLVAIPHGRAYLDAGG